jgi:hypothetical protein
MGGAVSAVSLHQLDALPKLVSRERFHLLTGEAFSDQAYDAFADQNGQITNKRMRELVLQRDIVFSFDWGIDNKGRSCVRRVQKITDFLTANGLIVASDDDQNNFIAQSAFGGNKVTPRDRIRERMDKVQLLLLALTQRYFTKVSDHLNKDKTPGSFQANENILQMELDEFISKKGARQVLILLFEREAAITEQSPPPYFKLFQHHINIDMSSFESQPAQLEVLLGHIKKVIIPLREGGSYVNLKRDFQCSRRGR